ncbi:argininosuccinate lyase, partial [Candidatus Margulisiibacteriota bacterium]
MTKKAWSGRFSKDVHKAAEKFSASIDVDQCLYEQDIQVNVAYAKALKDAKVLSASETTKIIKALNSILLELKTGKAKLYEQLEDVHMNIEALLIKKVGDIGKKLHAGRSRNDLVSTDLRLFLKKQVDVLSLLITSLQKMLIAIAEQNKDLIIPGYTHLQQAQPVLLSHHLLAYFEMLERDKERIEGALSRIDVMPLGSAALAGSGFSIDRKKLAKELGFSKISENSIDAVSDRDFVVEVIFVASMIITHLSRFCEELVIWSSQEFGFITIGDDFTTGSSIMPQKKNPDMAELIRGKAGGVYGSLIAVLTMLKGLPLSYNRDLQEDKKPLFDSIGSVENSLLVFTCMLGTVEFNKNAIAD